MKRIVAVGMAAVCLLLMAACDRSLEDQPMSTTTTSNTTAIVRVHGIEKLTRHLKENGVVWDREEEGDLRAVLAGAKAGKRLFNGEHYIDIYLFDMEDASAEGTLNKLREDRELESDGKTLDVEWREPFAIEIEDQSQRQQVLDALRSYQ